MKNEKNSSLILFLILTIFLGLISGAVSSFIIRSYALGDIFGFKFFGEMNLSNGDYRGSNLVISGAKKVVVEQNDKVVSTIDYAKSGLVGIFRKKTTNESSVDPSSFSVNDYYEIEDEIAQGLVITSDGWILTNFAPENLNYVVITNDKRVFSIDKIVADKLTSFYFLHVKASDLSVRNLTDVREVKNGEMVLAVDWNGKSEIVYVSDVRSGNNGLVNSSDIFYREIFLSNNTREDFDGFVIFNLSGDVVGVLTNKGKVEPMIHFESAIRSLLKNGTIVRPALGLNYINLSDFIGAIATDVGQGKYTNGALVYNDKNGIAVMKNSAAEFAGIKNGDIITAIDNIEINSSISLSEIIQKFSVGDMVALVILRNGEKKEIEVELK